MNYRETMNGILNIHKPAGMSSFKCMSIVKRRLYDQIDPTTRPKFKNWRVGFLGTLDPLASGVLVLLCGKATKLADSLHAHNQKVYRSVFTFGIETTTLDNEGEVIARSDVIPTLEQIKKILPEMVGDIEIEVPKFSAVHIDGKRAYDLARQGVDFTPPKKVVNIKRFELIRDLDVPVEPDCEHGALVRRTFEIECQTGTYIRSLAKLMAQKLGTVAIASTIIRTRVGDFKIEDAKSLEDVSLKDVITIENPK